MSYTREANDSAISLQPVSADEYSEWLEHADPRHRTWLNAAGFKGKPGTHCKLPGPDGQLDAVVFGTANTGYLAQLVRLANALPKGDYQLVSDWSTQQRELAALGWGLAQYRFDRYKKKPAARARLVLDEDIAVAVERLCAAQCLVRDLVNTPTEDMGPPELAAVLAGEAERFGAKFNVVEGDALLEENFPAIHAVGRAADLAPRLAILEWGEGDQPLLVLAGKGVCFDSGGLDIKSAAGMLLMKQDMGGAAHMIALARLVMENRLPVRLMVLIPAVENAISGNAYRPGDVVHTRKGLTIEVGNTDAEGRVVLSDALTYGCEHGPDLVIDFATLTGAARVAMGPDVPPLFSNRREVARGLVDASEKVEDPLWELPLYKPYRKLIDSEIADISNTGKTSYGGAITAALFLQDFVDADTPWVHVDTFAWNQTNRPGRPVGGEALGLRATFRYLQKRYGAG